MYVYALIFKHVCVFVYIYVYYICVYILTVHNFLEKSLFCDISFNLLLYPRIELFNPYNKSVDA